MHRKLNIVVVEDNRMTQVLLKNYLEGKGHKVVGCAQDGPEAVELVRMRQPDVVFLDVQLLTTSGFDVLTDVKALFPEIVVLMLSGHCTPALVQAALDRGALAYLTKPFDFAAINAAVESARKLRLPLLAA